MLSNIHIDKLFVPDWLAVVGGWTWAWIGDSPFEGVATERGEFRPKGKITWTR